MAAASLVSVVVPCYNHAHYLAEAVASVVAQTYRSWELLIVDDGSPDDTAEVARRLIAAHPGYDIRLIRQPNQGLVTARNTGFRAARGVYVLPLDADDLIEPEMLAATVPLLDAHRELGFVYTDAWRFGQEQTPRPSRPFSLAELRYDVTWTPTALVRHAAWEQVGGYSRTMDAGYEDWDFWLRLARAGWPGHHVARPLFRYRRVGSAGMLSRVRAHDLELRATIIRNHAPIYPPDLVAWAGLVGSPGWSSPDGMLRSVWRRQVAFVLFAALMARHCPQRLPRVLLRPLFWRLPVRGQGYARTLARWLHVAR